MATFSQSVVEKGSDSIIDFCCSPCLEHKIDQWAEFYCDNCLKLYCSECVTLHGQLFGKHVTYGRGDTSKWPVSKEVENFLQKCDLHQDKCLEMYCNDHNQLCCTNCFFLSHRLCAKVTLISESVKGPLPDLQKLSREIQTILKTIQKKEENWNAHINTSQASCNKQLDKIRDTRQKINTILDKIEEKTIKELDDMLTSLKASVKTDADNCSKLKNELKQLSGAIHDIVDKGKAELAFIASKKCLEKIKQSENYLKKNSEQGESSLTFKADSNVQEYLYTLYKVMQQNIHSTVNYYFQLKSASGLSEQQFNNQLVRVLIQMLKHEHNDDSLLRIGIILLDNISAQVESEQKKVLGDLEIVEVMCKIIQTKLKNKVCDEVLEGCWITLWNVTDETESNCTRFINQQGMYLFLDCFNEFSDKEELLRIMMGLMGNIVEVQKLRQNLMNEEYVTVFTNFLESKKDGIEFSAAGVLSHLLSDGKKAWTVNSPCRDEVILRIEQAIQRWPLDSQLNMSYSSFGPILNLVRCFWSHASQYWAVWTLCNLTKVEPDKYIKLLKEEGGLELMEKVVRDERPIAEIKELAKQVIDRAQNPVEVSEVIGD